MLCLLYCDALFAFDLFNARACPSAHLLLLDKLAHGVSLSLRRQEGPLRIGHHRGASHLAAVSLQLLGVGRISLLLPRCRGQDGERQLGRGARASTTSAGPSPECNCCRWPFFASCPSRGGFRDGNGEPSLRLLLRSWSCWQRSREAKAQRRAALRGDVEGEVEGEGHAADKAAVWWSRCNRWLWWAGTKRGEG